MFLTSGSRAQHGKIHPVAKSTGWIRPVDWPVMPYTPPNTINILAAIFNNGSNFCALAVTCVGGYTVNWGDGTAPQTYSSAATAVYQYTYGASGLGLLTLEGYQTALITITPTTTGNITAIDLGKKHTQSNLQGYSQPWLDLQVNAPSATSFVVYSTLYSEYLSKINIVAIGSVTSLLNAFYGCSSLQNITFPSGSLGSVTSLVGTFNTCTSLQSITFPSGSLGSVANLTNMCVTCPSLQSVTFPSGSLGSVTNLLSTFNGCSSLQNITFPSGSLGNVTSLSQLFYGCTSLQSITFPSGSLGSVTNLSYAFYGCSSLQNITFPSGSLGSVSTTTVAFTGCPSLSSITNCGIPVSFTISGCCLGATALNAIYTSLPTITSQTITRGTTNWGASSDTTSIATGKGWTVA